jgi:hypothetical protein
MRNLPITKSLQERIYDYDLNHILKLINNDLKNKKISTDSTIYQLFTAMDKSTCKAEPNKCMSKPYDTDNKVFHMDVSFHLQRPYTIQEAVSMFDMYGSVEGVVQINADDLCDTLDGELQRVLVELLIDGNSTALSEDVDIEIEGCDPAGLYFRVRCNTDPAINSQSVE